MIESVLSNVDDYSFEYDLNLFQNSQTICRFCLTSKRNMRLIDEQSQLEAELTELFHTITYIQLDFSSTGYSPLICKTCINNLRTMAQLRKDLIQIDSFWKRFLNSNLVSLEIVQLEATGIESHYINDEENQTYDKTSTDTWSALLKSKQLNDDCDNLEYIDESSISDIIVDDIEKSLSPTNQNIDTVTSSIYDDPQLDPTFEIYVCEICNKEFQDLNALTTHFKQHKNKTVLKTLATDQNPIELNIKTADETLNRKQKRKKFTCQHCGNIIENLKNLRVHLLREHPNEPQVECFICKKQFLHTCYLLVHMKTHGEKKYKCTYCSKMFLRKRAGRIHERIHTDERPYVCELCGCAFRQWNVLETHKKSHSRNKQKKIFRCSLCDSSYTQLSTLKKHLLYTHGEEGEQMSNDLQTKHCFRCGFIGLTEEDLIEHRKTHLKYQCEMCIKQFLSLKNLNSHMRLHSNKARPVSCDLCRHSFTCTDHLNQHIRRIHTTERPFPCIICNKCFRTKYEMVNHKKAVHDKERRFKCNFCTKTYTTSAALYMHKTRNHVSKFIDNGTIE